LNVVASGYIVAGFDLAARRPAGCLPLQWNEPLPHLLKDGRILRLHSGIEKQNA